MVHAIFTDQIEFSKTLVKAGSSKKLADAIASGAPLVDTSHLATKVDLIAC